MRRIETIKAKIAANKDLTKRINTLKYYSVDDFIRDVRTYIQAVKSRRMLCVIPSVSRSGMSRNIRFHSFEGTKTGGNYRQYWAMFKVLGYSEARGDRDAFAIGGCGMDMVFHTNYTNIHRFEQLGFLTKKQSDHLAQQTPVIL